jgi:hypothetical protein
MIRATLYFLCASVLSTAGFAKWIGPSEEGMDGGGVLHDKGGQTRCRLDAPPFQSRPAGTHDGAKADARVGRVEGLRR